MIENTPLTVELLIYSGFVEIYDCQYQTGDITIFHEKDRSFTLYGNPVKMETLEQLQRALDNYDYSNK